MTGPTHRLQLHDEVLAVCRLDPSQPIPRWRSGRFHSVTRTPDELSIVCEQAAVPPDVMAHGPWRALTVEGPLDFSMVGVLATLATTLAEADVPVFVVSTFDTDWILVAESDVAAATSALEADGHTITGQS